MNVQPKLAIVLRTWSNNKGIEKAALRALATGAVKVFVVIKDEDPAHFGSVQGWLAGLLQSNINRLVLLPMRVGYSWSNALNYAFEEVRRHNLRAAMNSEPQIESVLNVSNEVQFTPEHLSMMMEKTDDPSVDAVGTSFAGKMNGNPVDLGKSYIHPRNTMMLVRFEAYLRIGGFSPRCDQLGGQEDLDWLIRLEQSGRQWIRLDLRVPLMVGQNFDQATKERREMHAMTDIMSMNADLTKGMASAFKRMFDK